MDTEKREKRRPNPRASSNFISSLFLFYMIPIFYRSFKKGLTEEDLFEPLNEHKSKKVGEKLETLWYRYKNKYKKWSLHLALTRAFGVEMLIIGLLTLIKELITIIFTPILIGKLVAYFSQTTEVITYEEAIYYAIGLIACMVIERIVSHPSMMWIMHVAMKMRISCSALIYRKTLRLSKSALAQTTVGHVVNLLSNDVSKFDQGFVLAHFSWVAPIQSIVAIFFLYREIGVACFLGVGFLFMLIPLQMLMAKRTSVLRLRTALRTDERVRVMNEIISGIQVIKMYTWEKPFAKLIAAIRRKEMQSIRAHKILIALTYSIELFASRTAIFISLVSYVLMGESVTAERAYGITAIYNVIKTTITFLFTISITSLAEVHISIKRIKQFLDYEELPSKMLTPPPIITKENGNSTNGLNGTAMSLKTSSPRVILNNVHAKWNIDQTEDTLTNVNINITNPQLFAVIGPVGSGKSSLLNVILSELPVSSGELQVDGKVSFSSQEPWLFNANVRQNILFGDEYDEQRYRKVCKVCQLESDFAQLPHGDKTIVGERGKTLSGGQKARVNLARACYKKADIYLLDDPLSAVDANVGKKLFKECIRGFLEDKICILITHQLQYLKNADNILIFNDGEVSGLGTYNELQNSGLDFAKLLEEFQTPEEEVEARKIKSRQNSVNSESDEIKSLLQEEDEEDPTVEKENLGSGQISFATYRRYFRAGGNYCAIFCLILAFITFEVVSKINDYFVTYWVNTEQYFAQHPEMSPVEQNATRNILIYEYSGLTVVTILLAIMHNLFIFIFLMRASVNLHNYIFRELAKSKMKFFNANPTGRILNRFSRDMGVMDEYLPYIITDVSGIGLLLAGVLLLTSIINPLLMPPALVLMLLFYLMRIVYLKTSRSVKRIEGITRSPIFNQMTATMNGLSTIRAFEAENILIKEFDGYQDLHSSAWFIFIASTRAFGFWLDMICVIFISGVVIFLLVWQNDMYGGDLGLIITQYMGLMGSVQWGMRQWSELENQMTSVERILEYTKLESEPIREDTTELPENWPEKGKLEFKNMSMRYLQNDPPVLKNLNFVVNPGEKIGIVGRTGAGKSSIIVSLFQLYELEGSILIDDIDTTKVPLNNVRPKVAIIPQEPILFSGTMRKNLDPFDEYTDDMLWNALEQVELKDVIAEMPQGLHTNISEGGSNYSIGQRQLVCLARAIIKNNKILVLDEATANVDPHTDALIQNTVRKKFADCTVLTIAHRLHTVMDSDKILVMDAGRLIEYDTPHMLLQQEKGIFREMVDTTGPATSKNLKELAEKVHNEKKQQ